MRCYILPKHRQGNANQGVSTCLSRNKQRTITLAQALHDFNQHRDNGALDKVFTPATLL
jgi:hypothetical protein